MNAIADYPHSRLSRRLLVLSFCSAALIQCVQVDSGEEPAVKTWGDAERISDIGNVPRVAIDTNGDTIAVWARRRTDVPSAWQVWSRRHDGVWDALSLVSDADLLGDIRSRQVSLHPSGNAVVVWDQSDGTRYDIWSNRFTPAGGWGKAERIEADDRGDANSPDEAMDLEGNVVAVWHQSDGVRFGIWSTRYSSGGGWGTAERIATDTAGDARDPRVAMSPSGDASAVWRQSDGMRDDIWSNRYTASGGWGRAERIGTDSGGGALAPQIVMDADGNALTVWQQSDGTRYSIWSNRYSPAGGWAAAEIIETSDAGDALDPRVAMEPSGSAVAVWEQFDGSTFDIWSNRYEEGWSIPELVETNDAGDATNPKVAMGPDRSAVSVWKQFDGSSQSIWSNRLTERRGWGTAEQINVPCSGNLYVSDVAMDLDGNAVAAWSIAIGWGDPCHGIWTNRME